MQAVFPPVIIRKPLVLLPTQCVLSAAWRHTTVTVSCVICPASAWQNSYLSNCFSPFVFFLFCFKMWWGWGGGIYCCSMIWGGDVFKADKDEEYFPKVCSKKWKLRLKPIKIHTKVGKKVFLNIRGFKMVRTNLSVSVKVILFQLLRHTIKYLKDDCYLSCRQMHHPLYYND